MQSRACKISIELSESVTVHQGFRNDQGDPELVEYEHEPDKNPIQSQSDYDTIRSLVEENGGTFIKTIARTGDGTSTLGPRRGPLYFDLGSDITTVVTAIAAVGTTGVAAIILKNIKDIIIQWLNNHASRSVTLKIGRVTVKIRGSNDIEEALKTLERLPQKIARNPITRNVVTKSAKETPSR